MLVLLLWSWVQVAERAFKTGGGAGRVLVPPPCQLAKRTCARCGGAVSWLCVQAVYILVPASRMSTGRGMLHSYLGLCWFSFTQALLRCTIL